MDFHFTPTNEQESAIKVPFYEDARADFAPNYSSSLSVERARSAVMVELVKLGAGMVVFQEGEFTSGKVKRIGYVIHFHYAGAKGVIRVAGLPMRTVTPVKKDKVRVQALLNVRDQLKAAITSQVFSPGSEPLMQYLLVDGDRTLAEYVATQRGLPLLNPASDVIEADFTVVKT